MFSNTDRTQLATDLTAAAKAQDTRAISRLADHGLDMGIIDESTHGKFVVLGKVLHDLNRKDGEWYANILVNLARNI